MRTEHYGIINYAVSDLTIEKLYIRAYIGLGMQGRLLFSVVLS